MKPVPKITDTEWKIMRVVWAKHPITAAGVIEQLVTADPTWHPKTARTLLARLVRKGALDYEPLVAERECMKAASESFLERVFGGSLQPMLAHFVEERRLTKKDLDALRRLLEDGADRESSQRGRKRWDR